MNAFEKMLAVMAAMVVAFVPSATAVEVALNEIVASNATILADEDGDYEDWIELFNFGLEPVELAWYGLSDDIGNPYRWLFPPGVVIEPGGFLLVWASGKDRRNPQAPLHTNFRISSSGEEILLTAPSGERIDEIPPTGIPTNISYGRWPDGTGDWHFFKDPTPGSGNITTRYSEVLEPPTFSRTGGFYTSGFDLHLSHPDSEATIVYTLDGSRPDINNANGTEYEYKNRYPGNPGEPFGGLLRQSYRSYAYSGPLEINDRSSEEDKLARISSTPDYNPDYFPSSPVRKAFVVQAAATKDGAVSSRPAAHTYFVLSQGNPYGIPVISIHIQENLLFDYYDGIYTPGVDFDSWREDDPNRADNRWYGNYHRRGYEWEYPVHIEVYEPGIEQAVIHQGAGLRIHGGASRSLRLKNLRLYARNRYDDTDVFQHSIFSEPAAFSTAPENDLFRRILLRSHGAPHGGYVRDAVSHKLMQPVFEGVHRVSPAIHFINGEYWGITSYRDRFDQHHLANNYGLDPDNIVILHSPVGAGRHRDINVGERNDLRLYQDMYYFVIDNDMALGENYSHLKTLLDVRSWVDYYQMNIYLGKIDWQGIYHFGLWRVREPSDTHFGDGRWRAYTWDFDYGATEDVNRNYLDEAINDYAPEATALLRNLLVNDDFKYFFINRFADHLNTTFIPERVEGIFQEVYGPIAPYLEENFHRWNFDIAPGWVNTQYINYAYQRPPVQRRHIREQFGISRENQVTLDVSSPEQGYVRVNTIEIKGGTPGIEGNPYPWTGIYFSGIPIELEAIPAPGYEFSHWEGPGLNGYTEPIVGVTPHGDISVKAHFRPSTQPGLLYFWMFDGTMPNNTPLEEVEPVYAPAGAGLLKFDSALSGYPFFSGHPMWRKASMERRNSPTDINYRPEGNQGIDYGESDMRGLQIRQPFTEDAGENTLVFHLPTNGYEDIVFRLAARDEGAADELLFDYSVVGGSPEWTTAGLDPGETGLIGEYRLYELDFSAVAAVNHNPNFRIRIRFSGEDMEADDGNRVTFNNISLEGKPSPGSTRRPWIYDYDGDGTSDIAVYRPSSGLWAVRDITRVYFGSVGDLPVPGDYSGDGTTDIAVFRPSSGLWAIRGISRVYFGSWGDIPVPGDYEGSGSAELGIYRESSGLWAIRGVTRVYFGTRGDEPAGGYYTPDGRKSIGIYRPATGLWAIRGVTRLYFGSGEDEPVPGDYSGDGLWSPGVFRPASGLWALGEGSRVYFGAVSDDPVPGGYSGEGRDLPGVFRSSSGLWAIRGMTRLYFGSEQDIPVTR